MMDCCTPVSAEEGGFMGGGTCARVYGFDVEALLAAGPAKPAMEGRL